MESTLLDCTKVSIRVQDWKVGSPEATWVNTDTNPEEEKVELPHCFAHHICGRLVR